MLVLEDDREVRSLAGGAASPFDRMSEIGIPDVAGLGQVCCSSLFSFTITFCAVSGSTCELDVEILSRAAYIRLSLRSSRNHQARSRVFRAREAK